MSRRQEVTDAIARILSDELPDIPWTVLVKGLKRSKQTEGTISCDEVSYSFDAKGSRNGRAIYSVYVVAAGDSVDIDDVADRLDAVIFKNPTLDNWATTARVTQILFGVSQGQPQEAGVLLATLDVTYDSD